MMAATVRQEQGGAAGLVASTGARGACAFVVPFWLCVLAGEGVIHL